MKIYLWSIILTTALLCSGYSYAQTNPPIISLDTNCGSYFYSGGNAIMVAPALGFKIAPSLSLTPLYTYAKKWGNLTLYNETNNKLQDASPLAPASEEIVKNIPDDFFSEKYHYVDYAVQGRDYFLPANRGEIFKEYPDLPVRSVTPRPRNDKICVVYADKGVGTVANYRISVVDTKTKNDLLSFEWSCSTSAPGFMDDRLEWVDDRYLLEVGPGRRWTFITIIDLEKKTVIDRGFGDLKEILSAAVINGKVVIIRDGDANGVHPYTFPLEH